MNEGGYWYVRDLQSRNGIKVNDVASTRSSSGSTRATSWRRQAQVPRRIRPGRAGRRRPAAGRQSLAGDHERVAARAGRARSPRHRPRAAARSTPAQTVRPDEHEGGPDRAAGRPGVRARELRAGAESQNWLYRSYSLLPAPCSYVEKEAQGSHRLSQEPRSSRARQEIADLERTTDSAASMHRTASASAARATSRASAPSPAPSSSRTMPARMCCPTSTASVCRLGRVLRVQGLHQHRARRTRRDVSMRHAPAAEDAGHRSAARRGGGRHRLVSARRRKRRHHRARRAAARRGQPHQPRPAARARGQRRSARHRHQRGRAAAQAESHRPPARHRREGRHPADHLHQQDRPGRAGRPDAAGRRVRQLGYDVLLVSAATGIGHRSAARPTGRRRKRRHRPKRRRQVVAAQRRRARTCICACRRSARKRKKAGTRPRRPS